MKRKMNGILAVLAMVTASVVSGVTPAQASVSTCISRGGVGNSFYQVRCFGNPATHPNQYRAWVTCSFGPWWADQFHFVDPVDPDESSAACAYGAYVTAKGYDVM